MVVLERAMVFMQHRRPARQSQFALPALWRTQWSGSARVAATTTTTVF